jgi:hypothetical protein
MVEIEEIEEIVLGEKEEIEEMVEKEGISI